MPAKIKQGKYVDSDGVQQDVVFIGAEKAIFDDNGTRLDNKLTNMSRASGLTAEDAEGILRTADANVNFQSLVDAIADKVMNELVTNSALTTTLANYVTKAMMSNVQVNNQNMVPTSSLAFSMNQAITELNSDLNNRIAVSDLNAAVDVSPHTPLIVQCDVNTLNTPYKAGLTSSASGTAYITGGSDSDYLTMLYMPASAPNMFIRSRGGGTWYGWERILKNADLARQVVSFSYHANIEHQAGVSYASGNILYISECIQVNTAVSANANILTNVKRGGTTINAPYTYGIIFQNGNAHPCNLEGSTVKTETALETGYAFIILVTALP